MEKIKSRKQIKNEIAVVIFTKNEEINLSQCLKSVKNFENIYVIDSQSTDGTTEIAKTFGVEVIQFNWDGKYPRKKQWTLKKFVNYEWVLMLDADERITPSVEYEIREILNKRKYAAAEFPLEYHFCGKKLKFGHSVKKRILLKPQLCRFPDVEVEGIGNGDIEFHYQPEVDGDTFNAKSKIIHDEQDPFIVWVKRHVLYAEIESKL